jgi:hypothetical protein
MWMPFVAKYLWYFLIPFRETGLAQLVEHWSPKPGVGSSSLSTRAN